MQIFHHRHLKTSRPVYDFAMLILEADTWMTSYSSIMYALDQLKTDPYYCPLKSQPENMIRLA